MEQRYYHSKVFWRALFTVVVLAVKEMFGYELPNEIVDNVLVVILLFYTGYGIRNNPSIQNTLDP